LAIRPKARLCAIRERGNTMEPFEWECPFCNRPTTITKEDRVSRSLHLTLDNKTGRIFGCIDFVVCPNPKCKKFTFSAGIYDEDQVATGSMKSLSGGGFQYCPGSPIQTWRLIPLSKVKAFPSYIPAPILEDYEEACVISELSPKASATLSRRCLQGMIRDFWKVKPGHLVNEIAAIQNEVDPLTWDAIDSVRNVGNIGAHMEKDINVIVDVDPNEAELLIRLVETLLHEWYVAREERKKQLEKIKAVGEGKKEAKKAKPTTS